MVGIHKVNAVNPVGAFRSIEVGDSDGGWAPNGHAHGLSHSSFDKYPIDCQWDE